MKLTIRQRVICYKVAAAQVCDLTTRELWDDIQTKVGLTDTEKEATFKALPNGQVLMDLSVMDTKIVDIPFEKQESRFLKEGLEKFTQYEQGDPAWVRKLIKELEQKIK